MPVGCEKICDYLSFDFGDFFSWNYDFDSNDELCPAIEIDAGAHRIHELPPRFDFFRKHECAVQVRLTCQSNDSESPLLAGSFSSGALSAQTGARKREREGRAWADRVRMREREQIG